ncbi:uncharacterized protein METZ01_LOCUS112702, partial [marine metagenome]
VPHCGGEQGEWQEHVAEIHRPSRDTPLASAKVESVELADEQDV